MVQSILLFCIFMAGIWWLINITVNLLIRLFPGKKLREAQKEYDRTTARTKNLERIYQQNLRDIKFLRENPEKMQDFLRVLDSELNTLGITKQDDYE